jgi:hypothetical protein
VQPEEMEYTEMNWKQEIAGYTTSHILGVFFEKESLKPLSREQ